MKQYGILAFSIWIIILPLIPCLPIGLLKEDLGVFPTIILTLLLLGILLNQQKKSNIVKYQITSADIWLGIFIIYTLLRFFLDSNDKVDDLILYKIVMLCIVYMSIRNIRKKTIILNAISIGSLLQSIIVYLQRFGYFESRHYLFDVTGTFGNPGQVAGYIVVGAMISLSLCRCEVKRNNINRVILYASFFTIQSIALSFADSRASFIAFIAGIIFIWSGEIKGIIKNRIRLFVPLLLLYIIILCFSMFRYRPASVEARILIWYTSLNMFSNKPILGHGIGHFEKLYMPYQADFFKKHPQSHFTSVADNVSFPYNELLRIGVEWGIIGVIIILSCLKSLFNRRYDEQDINIKGVLVTLLVFSMFSYPFDVLPLLLLFPILTGLSKSQLYSSPYFSQKYIKGWQIACFITCIVCFKPMFFYVKASKQIKEIINENANLTIKTENFRRLLPNTTFANHFAYCIQQKNELFSDSLIDYLPPTCETYCSYGDIFANRGLYKKAEAYYKKAGYMIPTRLTPNYKLWKLYILQGDTIHAIRKAQYILQQNLKIENSFTLKAKTEIKSFLKNECTLKNKIITAR